MATGDDLKTIILTRLNGAASSLFLDKSLSIIDESADNMESFISVAERISKRTALFIDADTAESLLADLRERIGESALLHREDAANTKGSPYAERCTVICNQEVPGALLRRHFTGRNISQDERASCQGFKSRTHTALEEGTQVCLSGVIVYTINESEASVKKPAGIAVEFSTRNNTGIEKLRSYLENVSDLEE